MATKKETVYREVFEITKDKEYAKRTASKAKRENFKGYEEIIDEGRKLFLKDIKNI